MRSWDALPESALQPAGPLTAAFLARGMIHFRAVGRCLHTLPYGRTVDRADFRAVLREGKGTCSTKHALLAALAQEQTLPVRLTLGIYDMHERNTPGVGAVLARYSLTALPEAHCYLTYMGTRIDITRSGAAAAEPISALLHEETIVPEQIGDSKVLRHQHSLREWVHTHADVVGGRSVADVWKIREECIAALAQ